MPNSPLQSMYGFSLICSIAEVPSSVKILTAAALPIPYSPRNNISERIPMLCFSCREKSSAFDFEIPLSIATLSGSFSITSRVFSPNSDTSLCAVVAPIPRIAPEER